MSQIKELKLKKQEDRRIKAGHLWIYSNEIDASKTPLSSFSAGDLVTIVDSRGHFLAHGYINPHTLICVRILTRDRSKTINVDFFQKRIERALELRKLLFNDPYYRLIYSESDSLPGLIIDRFNNNFVAQFSTAGMDKLKDQITMALKNLFPNANILAKNNLSARKLELLPLEDQVLSGTLPSHLDIIENGTEFSAPVFTGQKTGWFFDQRSNRLLLQKYVVNKSVLDVCCYLGGFGVQAACFGATKVTCVDASASALEMLQQNAVKNNVADKVTTITGDAFDVLKTLIEQKERYDVIVLDPPAFIKNRSQIKSGIQGYLKLHNLALQLLNSGGILFSASCSMHLSYDDLVDVIRKASLEQQKNVRIIANLDQDVDHPVHPAIRETKYLKGVVIYSL